MIHAPRDPVLTIDGSAGTGKSTADRKLAARLQIAYLDTGALYRALALKMVRGAVDEEDSGALLALARSARIDVDCGPTYQRIRLGGRHVSDAFRSMQVSRATCFPAPA